MLPHRLRLLLVLLLGGLVDEGAEVPDDELEDEVVKLAYPWGGVLPLGEGTGLSRSANPDPGSAFTRRSISLRRLGRSSSAGPDSGLALDRTPFSSGLVPRSDPVTVGLLGVPRPHMRRLNMLEMLLLLCLEFWHAS